MDDDDKLAELIASTKDNQSPVGFGYFAKITGAFMVAHKKMAARITKLEQRRTMSFEGAHDPGRQYAAGDAVQRSGALFVCLAATSEAPGDSAAWRRIGISK